MRHVGPLLGRHPAAAARASRRGRRLPAARRPRRLEVALRRRLEAAGASAATPRRTT